MKVVYNACYGGFSLSDEAIVRYLQLKGWVFTTEKDEYGFIHYKVEGQDRWYHRDIPRADKHLVQVVEEMGKAANGRFADLAIEDVPSGARWRIDEYDGFESVMKDTDYEWQIAD